LKGQTGPNFCSAKSFPKDQQPLPFLGDIYLRLRANRRQKESQPAKNDGERSGEETFGDFKDGEAKLCALTDLAPKDNKNKKTSQ